MVIFFPLRDTTVLTMLYVFRAHYPEKMLVGIIPRPWWLPGWKINPVWSQANHTKGLMVLHLCWSMTEYLNLFSISNTYRYSLTRSINTLCFIRQNQYIQTAHWTSPWLLLTPEQCPGLIWKTDSWSGSKTYGDHSSILTEERNNSPCSGWWPSILNSLHWYGWSLL